MTDSVNPSLPPSRRQERSRALGYWSMMATAGQLSAYSSAASSPTTPGGAACPSAMSTPETGNRSLARFDHAHSRKSGGGHTP